MADCGVSHHKACDCREEAVERLCEEARDKARVLEEEGFPLCAAALRNAVAAVRGLREESKDG